MYCEKCGIALSQDARFCVNCGNELSDVIVMESNIGQKGFFKTRVKSRQLGMKWYKFVINFQLIAAGITCALAAYLYISGNVHFSENGVNVSQLTYSLFKGLKIVDRLYGIINLALVPLIVVVRHKLACFKKDAPAVYLIFLGAYLGSRLLYRSAIWALFGADYVDLTYLTMLVITGISLILYNRDYFIKRKHLFIN